MPNNYFQFKQFTVWQQKSSMKVCTDSCLFGAWIANLLESSSLQPKSILDVGTGMGLLTLMLAQKTSAKIDAVEIHEESFEQSNDNFNASPWSNRIRSFNADIKNWVSKLKYDLVISNPPFFENDLKATHQGKNIAKHHDTLTLKDLLVSIKNNLAEDGKFAILLPFHRSEYFKQLALDNGFYLIEEMLVKQTPAHPWFRAMQYFSDKPCESISKELVIKNSEGAYTKEFEFLLKDYYLQSNF